MLEQTLERIAIALEKMAKNNASTVYQVDLGEPTTTTEPVVKKTRKAKKKKAPKEEVILGKLKGRTEFDGVAVAVETKKEFDGVAVGSMNVELKTMAAGATTPTKLQVTEAIKANVVSHGGEDTIARAIFNEVQGEGATLSTLSESNYAEIITRLNGESGE